AHALEHLDHAHGIFLERVAERDDAEQCAAARNDDGGFRFAAESVQGLFKRREIDALALEEARTAGHREHPVDPRAYAEAGQRLEVPGFRYLDALGARLVAYSSCDGVLRAFLGGSGGGE